MTTEAFQQGSSSATVCAKPPRCEDRTGSKGAEILNSAPPGYEPSYAEGAPSAPTFIIGFDAEWVEVQDEPSDDPDSELSDPSPHNLVLSYQYACRHDGQAWSGIIYALAGARIRYPELAEKDLAQWPERLNFAVVLAEAISAGVDAGHIHRWPKHVIATAHWTRADLSAMANHAEIKGQFDGVQKTYVTLSKRYRARVSIGKRIRSFQVTLVDTQLLAPGSSKSLEALGDLYGFPKLKPG
jgi:hypothetical protein